MNRLSVLTTLCGLAMSVSVAYAADLNGGSVLGEPSGFVVAQQTDSRKPQASSQESDKQWAQMQEHMKQMQTQMEKIHKTTDPKERQKLMQEHMQSMREHMKMMHGAGGCMMMGMMARGDQSGTGKPDRGMNCGMMDADPSHRQETLEQRMDMMQMMMDQMMQHEEATQAKPK
jgi:TolA-binding protein